MPRESNAESSDDMGMVVAKKIASSKAVSLVSSDMILHGAFFALRQAWELLSAAKILERGGKFSSAYGLAAFCREEIGKSKLLEQYWYASLGGKTVSSLELNSGDMRSHTKKLRAAGKLLSQGTASGGTPPEPGSREAQESLRQLREINARARERDPERTHLGRLHAFYVEVHESGAAWWQPRTGFDSVRTGGEVDEADIAYVTRRGELEEVRENVRSVNLELADSLCFSPELE